MLVVHGSMAEEVLQHADGCRARSRGCVWRLEGDVAMPKASTNTMVRWT